MGNRIQVSAARSFSLVLLALLGLGAFASPAAAQVFDGFPFKGALFTPSPLSP